MEQDIILLILSCNKYYDTKAITQKNNWLKNIKIQYFHVIGEPTLSSNYEFDWIKNILYVKAEDDYISLPKKVIMAYSAIYEIFNFKYIFKTDDDQILLNPIFLENLKKVLLNSYSDENKRIHYGGEIIKIDKPYLSQYNTVHSELPENLPLLATQYCSGRFYFLSNFAVNWLLIKRKIVEQEYLEDYAIGFTLHDSFKTNIMNIQSTKLFYDMV
jgi:hypothetical protein